MPGGARSSKSASSFLWPRKSRPCSPSKKSGTNFFSAPIEMNAYIQEFQSPWIKAWFDVGNVLLYGYPQDWIRTLGKSIVKVHLKDFKRKKDGYEWVNLGDGDVDWEAVREAFREIGYSGSAICELNGGDEAYLRDVSRRVDRLVLGRTYGEARSMKRMTRVLPYRRYHG